MSIRLEINNPPMFTIKNLPNLIIVLSLTLKLKNLFNVNEVIIPKLYAIEFAIT